MENCVTVTVCTFIFPISLRLLNSFVIQICNTSHAGMGQNEEVKDVKFTHLL